MRIYFMRHGESEHNESGTISSWTTNPPLSKMGLAEASKARKKIPKTIVHIWCADFLRHRQTCCIINKYLILPVTYTHLLRERNFGSLQGIKIDEFKKSHPDLFEMDTNQQYDYRPFGGESFHDVDLRVVNCIERIKSTNEDVGSVLVITSAGIISLLYKKYKNTLLRIGAISNCSVHLFDV